MQDNNDPRAVRSRAALRTAMLTLLATRALEQITIRDIVAEAGIGYTTFFRHYPTREALLEDIAVEQIRTLFRLSLPVMDAENLRAGAIALLSYVQEQRALWSTLLLGGAAAFVREEFLRQARVVANVRGQSENLLPPDLGAILIVSGVLELIIWWLRQPEPASVAQVAEILDCTVVSPVIKAGQRKARVRR